MGVIIWVIIASALSLTVVRDLTRSGNKRLRQTVVSLNLILSLLALSLLALVIFDRQGPDTPRAVANSMNFSLLLAGIVFPRTLLVIFHYGGKLLRIGKSGYSRAISISAIVLYAVVALTVFTGYIHGRFNFRFERVTIEYEGLPADLDGLTIIHLSDLHLASFHGHSEKLTNLTSQINRLEADLIINTGDFITLGYREYGRFDTILMRMRARYGKYAVLGNHDIGTYLPESDADAVDMTIRNVSQLVQRSGYNLLSNSNEIIRIGTASLAITGAETRGRHPDIIHPDIGKAMAGTEAASLRILLSHDPNHWDRVLTENPSIDLTLSGHTHGMQVGIITPKFRWSPSRYFYPRWNGLYKEGDNYLYVNRGLGCLGIPARIGMPPEVTILTIVSKQKSGQSY